MFRRSEPGLVWLSCHLKQIFRTESSTTVLAYTDRNVEPVELVHSVHIGDIGEDPQGVVIVLDAHVSDEDLPGALAQLAI